MAFGWFSSSVDLADEYRTFRSGFRQIQRFCNAVSWLTSTLLPYLMKYNLLVCMLMGVNFLLPAYAQTLSDSVVANELYQNSRRYWATSKDSALLFLKRAEDLSRRIGYSKGEAYAIYGEGMNTSVLYEKFSLFTRSLEIFERNNDRFGQGLNLIKIGDVYNDIGQPEKALEYFIRALKVKQAIGDNGGTALTLIEIGQYYRGRDNHAEALKYFRESLVYRYRENSARGIAYAQFNIGTALIALGKPSEGLVHVDSAILNFSRAADDIGRIYGLSSRATALEQLQRQELAERVLKEIVSSPSRFRSHPSVLDAKKRLAQYTRKRGELKTSFALLFDYVATKDSLAGFDDRVATQRAVNEYEFKQMEQREQRKQAVRDAEVNRRNTLEYLVIAAVMLILFVLLFTGRNRLSEKVARAAVFMGLLLFFEFLLVLTDSSVEGVTGGEPIFNLIANVMIALFILPAHQWLESVIQSKMAAPATT